MRKGDTKLFLDKEKLYEMVNLRLFGFSLDFLALFYGCDKSTLRSICKKYGLYPKEIISPSPFKIVKRTVQVFIRQDISLPPQRTKSEEDFFKIYGVWPSGKMLQSFNQYKEKDDLWHAKAYNHIKNIPLET